MTHPPLRISKGSSLLLLALGSLACARSDEEWAGDLANPKAGTFQRGMAAIALAEQAPERAKGAVQPLLVLLDGPEGPLRPHAAEAIRKIAAGSASELVRTLVEATFLSEDCRKPIEEAIVSTGKKAVPSLLAAMREPVELTSRQAGLLLARIGDPAVDPLLEIAREEPTSRMGLDAIWVLGRCGPAARRALPMLLEALRGPHAEAILAAADSLWRIDPGGESVLPPLRESLSDPREIARVAAAQAITHLLVLRASRREDPKRLEPLREVVRFGEPILPSLLEEIASSEPGRQRKAWDCVLAIAARWTLLAPAARLPSRPVPRLRALLEETDELERIQAAIDLGRKGRDSVPAIASLLRASGDRQASVRIGAAVALSLIAVDLAWARFSSGGAAPAARSGR